MIQAEWSRTGTKEELEKYVGNGFRVIPGWSENETGSVYCELNPPTPSSPNGQLEYTIHVWNIPNARTLLASRLAEILGAKVTRC